AIGPCLRATRDAGGSAGAGDILHNELLSERFRKILSDDAGDDVRRAACRKGHNDSDRAGWIILGSGRGSRDRQHGCKSCKKPFHRSLLSSLCPPKSEFLHGKTSSGWVPAH